ncbi:LicD family protein [Paenibacillus typhae]|uniref:LicD family protein n=1 Tax=Paenibacillus typhae TaxID=1174501 RepID=UPI001C8D3BA6|nr:LicD family protein [Paenibacillus typhae]MBY0011668.1 LicD family protein [Paenibacillus typhae]
MAETLEADFFEEEVRCDYKVTKEIKKLWAVELDLIAKLKEVCEKYNLKFFMSGGTLLGAVRHQGFIPWDDDADFLMPREDFERLKKIAPDEFQDPYFLQTEENEPDIFLGGFARLRNSQTTKITYVHLNRNANLGIWIDISVLDNIYEDVNRRREQIKKIRYYQRLLFAKAYGELDKFLEVTPQYWKTLKTRASLLSRDSVIKKLLTEHMDCENSNYLACFTYHPDRYWPNLLEASYYSESIMMKFENLELPAPIGYEQQLKILYGDNYMSYPPADQRTPAHLGSLNTEVSYKKFILNFDKFALDHKELNQKAIVIFGAGQMLEHYLEHQGEKYPPTYVTDNNQSKWGTRIHNIPVIPPDDILSLADENAIIIICSIYYREISRQLKEMGADQFYIYVQEKDWLF